MSSAVYWRKKFTELSNSVSTLAFFWSCVESANVLDDQPPIPDELIVLNFNSHGASAFVTAGQIRAILKASEDPMTYKPDQEVGDVT